MALIIDENTIYKTSEAVALHPLDNDQFAVWNRYTPSVLFLNSDGIKLLNFMKTNNEPYKLFKGFKRTLRKMIEANLLYPGTEDPYEKNFFNGGETYLKSISQSLIQYSRKKTPYLGLNIFNHTCNLKCPYCIVDVVKNKNHKRSKISTEEKQKRLSYVIDRVMSDYTQDNKRHLKVMFNGGEILLDFGAIKHTVNYLNQRYPKARVDFNINTNATLITDEIADFLAKKNFNVIGISIDGYKETHNKSRRYHNGRGSFDDVIRGIERLNKHFKKPIRFFQGTLIPEHDLDIDKLLEMKEFNFDHARLGVNLQGISKEDAKAMAELHFKMAVKSVEKGWSAMDDYFKAYESTLGAKNLHDGFTFFCRGFSDLAGKSLYYNIETQRVNLLCHFITDAHPTFEEINGDIHHPLIFEKTQRYLQTRFEKIKDVCKKCEIVGICRGGCVLDGIDAFNKTNESACIFVKDTWKYYLQHVFKKKCGDDNI